MGRVSNKDIEALEEQLKKYKRILIDTNSFIYYMEDHEIYADGLQVVFDRIENGRLYGITSTLVLTEVLVKPIRERNRALQDQYTAFLRYYPNLFLRDIDHRVAVKAAKIRAAFGIKTPDSIFLATAFEENVEAFITNDLQLRRVEGIDYIILDEYLR